MALPPSLDRECTALHRYLTGRVPDDYTAATYRRAHATLAALQTPVGWFDNFLLRLAVLHAVPMHLVQAYTRFLAPAVRLRQKAVLLLAIIECNPATVDCVQPVGRPNPVRIIGTAIGVTARFAAAFVAGAIVVAPFHVVAFIGARLGANPALVRPVTGKET